MTRSYEPAPSIEKDVITKAQANIEADDNDTSFEIDEPEEEEIVDVIKDHTRTINETVDEIYSRYSSPIEVKAITSRSDKVSKDDVTPTTSTGRVGLQRVCKGSVRDESNDDSDCSYDSYTYSSTPTTADVADVAAISVYPSNNNCCSGSKQQCKRLIPPSHVLVIAVQTSQTHDTGSIADDNGSNSLATTTTDLDLDNTLSISPNNRQQSRIESSSNVVYNSTIHSIPSVLLTHPSAAFQDADHSTVEVTAAQTRRHQRTLSSTSHRSIASQHSVHTANTTLSITLPKSRIWTCLRWICLRFKVNI